MRLRFFVALIGSFWLGWCSSYFLGINLSDKNFWVIFAPVMVILGVLGA